MFSFILDFKMYVSFLKIKVKKKYYFRKNAFYIFLYNTYIHSIYSGYKEELTIDF